MARGRLPRGTAAAVGVGALAVSNVLTNRVLPDAAYVPWNLVLAGGMIGLARRTGVDDRSLGARAGDTPRGVGVGILGAGVVAAGYALVVRVGADAALQDRRATDLSPRRARTETLVRIPFGTVVLEEVAFRGVLPALLHAPGSPRWVADAAAAGLFGVWHVLPAQELMAANAGVGAVAGRLGRAGTTVLAVAGTTVAGLGLQLLARQGRHLAAPMLVHWAANALGLVAARVAGSRR